MARAKANPRAQKRDPAIIEEHEVQRMAPTPPAMREPPKVFQRLQPEHMPDKYAMVCEGDCMEPEIKDGACLHFSKSEAYKPGDLVILWRKAEATPGGHYQALVKRLVIPPPPWVTFPWTAHPDSEIQELVVVEMLNPPRHMSIRCSDLLAIHKCKGVVPEEMTRTKLTEEEMLAFAEAK